jgi:hypothetical protein
MSGAVSKAVRTAVGILVLVVPAVALLTSCISDDGQVWEGFSRPPIEQRRAAARQAGTCVIGPLRVEKVIDYKRIIIVDQKERTIVFGVDGSCLEHKPDISFRFRGGGSEACDPEDLSLVTVTADGEKKVCKGFAFAHFSDDQIKLFKAQPDYQGSQVTKR